jgi:hypothetical protein
MFADQKETMNIKFNKLMYIFINVVVVVIK